MPKNAKLKPKRIHRSNNRNKSTKLVSNPNDDKQSLNLKDKYISKLKDYFLFSECMFYNKEYLSWHLSNFSISESALRKCPLRLSYHHSISWKIFTYHKLIGQGSFGKGFISSLKNESFESKNKKLKICLIKMIGARKGEDFQNHYSQLINERDSLIKLSGVWTPRLYGCFIELKVAAIFLQEFIDGETITYVKKLIKIDNGIELYPLLLDALDNNEKSKDIPVLTQRQFEIIQFYIGELLAAIKYIHDHGVLHRDLKENNILLTCSGHLKLIDFGLAKRICSKEECQGHCLCATTRLIQSYVSGPHRLWGNRYYAAPEYITGEKCSFDDKGDYWAVGIIFFHLIFGCRPYKHIVTDKVKELSLSISNWKSDSFMQKQILYQRCKNHPKIIDVFFSLISDEKMRLCDLMVDNEQKWLPLSWSLFENFNLVTMYEYQPPIKIPSNKKIYSLTNQIPLSVISKSFSKEKYTEHLDCPYFNYITPFNNDLFDEVNI